MGGSRVGYGVSNVMDLLMGCAIITNNSMIS